MRADATTAEAARKVGIDRVTLQRWIRAGKVKPPKPKLRNGRGIRLWSKADVSRLRRVKKQIYRKGRGRKMKLAFQPGLGRAKRRI